MRACVRHAEAWPPPFRPAPVSRSGPFCPWDSNTVRVSRLCASRLAPKWQSDRRRAAAHHAKGPTVFRSTTHRSHHLLASSPSTATYPPTSSSTSFFPLVFLLSRFQRQSIRSPRLHHSCKWSILLCLRTSYRKSHRCKIKPGHPSPTIHLLLRSA